MKINLTQFEDVQRYLLYDKKFKNNKLNFSIYKSRFNIMCRFFEGKEFNRKNFVFFMEYLREKGYSTAYCNQFIKLAKHIDKLYEINELQDFTQYPKEQKLVDVLSDKQFIDLAEVKLNYPRLSEEINLKYRALIYVMYYTGARISEILTLQWEDLKTDPCPLIVFNQTKINDIRYAPIPMSMYDLLTSLPHYSGYVFSNKDGRVLDVTTINHTLKKRALAIGLNKRVYNHLLRHSFINIMLRNGARLHEVSRLVGHKTLETTNRHYVHVMIEELNDVLHNYHPALKKHQTLDSITKKLNDMCSNIIDPTRFSLRVFKKKNQVNVEIHEIE